MNLNMSLKERIAITLRGFRILKTYCPGLIQGKAISAFVSSLHPFASIWFSAQIINEISSYRRINHLIFYCLAVVFIHFIMAMIQGIVDKIAAEKESQMWSFFGKIFSDKQMSMDYVDLENAEIQHQKNKAEENLYMFGNGLGQLVWGTASLVEVCINIVVSLGMVITLFTTQSEQPIVNHPIWIGILLLCIIMGGLWNSKAFIKENKVFEQWCNGSIWFNRSFQFFGNDLSMSTERAKDLRIYEQNFITNRLLNRLIKRDKKESGYIIHMSILQGAASTVIGLSNVVCYLFVVVKAFFGAFSVGNIVKYAGVLSKLGDGIQGFMFLRADNAVYCAHLKGLFDFLDIPNKNVSALQEQGTQPLKICFNHTYEIEFKNVWFQYPGSETYALKNLNLKFNIGKRLAVVGMNGSGKTTMIKLLCRLYEPSKGEITLNGVNINQYDYNEYMSIFSVVFQDFKLFAFSLGQNVASSIEYDKEKVERCLKAAGFEERLGQMPNGVETCLYKEFEEDGVEISGGEAQKIALARALYKDAPFIILDEPTAALDPIAEFEIYSKFNEIVGGKTAIYISHRLSSCRFCDDIAVFHDGELIQRGRHEELLAQESKKYYELWMAQAQYYEEGKIE